MLKTLSDFDYTNVHAEADKADFRLTNKEGKHVILDSKKYKLAVPKKEREKLVKNTDQDATVCAGLMVSLNSKISARAHCEIEFTPSNKPVLYLCLQDMTTEAKQQTMDTALKLLLRLVATHNEKEKELLVEKIHSAFTKLDELAKKLENIKKSGQEILDTAKLCQGDVKCLKDILKVD